MRAPAVAQSRLATVRGSPSLLESVNLLLFEAGEVAAVPCQLPRADPRARHLLEVLRRSPGDRFDAGIVEGPRGRGRLIAIGAEALTLDFDWGAPAPPLDSLRLLIGLPRPQTARKLLQETAALGVAGLHFFQAEKGEPNYGQSPLWTGNEWRRHLLAGAAQAFDTRLPAVSHAPYLASALEQQRGQPFPAARTRIALDLYEASEPLARIALAAPVVLAFGPERGWSDPERNALRAAGFALAHLGSRVLRLETAVVAAVAVVKARFTLAEG
jgi:RsmE family RNA methyltransferase